MNVDSEQLKNVLRQVALPAMVGAAGSGALGAYMSRNPVAGESPSQRRHRILKNALISAGLGGMAGAALPIGLKTLSQPYVGASQPSGMFDRATDFGLRHIGAGAGGVAGGIGATLLSKNLGNKATERILSVLSQPHMALPPALQEMTNLKGITNPAQLRQLLDTGDLGHKFVLSALSGNGGGEDQLHRLFRSAEILGQAGGKNLGGSDLRRLFGQGVMPNLEGSEERNVLRDFKPPTLPEDLHGAYLKYLANEGATYNPRRLLAQGAEKGLDLLKMPAAERGVGGLAELYSRLARPGMVGSLMPAMRWGLPAALLGLGGAGAYLGSQAQNKLMGN